MKIKILIMILWLSALFINTGCPTIITSPQTKPLDNPVTIQTCGIYTHPQSSMEFPEIVGHFQRFEITRFDESGLNVGVSYNLMNSSFQMAVMVYIYPGPRMSGPKTETASAAHQMIITNMYEAEKSGIIEAHQGARLITDTEVILRQGEIKQKGMVAVFEYDGVFVLQQQQLVSHLYLFNHNGWMIKYRFTHPKNITAVTEEIDKFMQFLKWTAKRG
ncbi:MAG: hypothetical protein V1701_02160 [Planctomycetota bacterium]